MMWRHLLRLPFQTTSLEETFNNFHTEFTEWHKSNPVDSETALFFSTLIPHGEPEPWKGKIRVAQEESSTVGQDDS